MLWQLPGPGTLKGKLLASLSRFSSYWDTSPRGPQKEYLGCKQRLREAVNDESGIEPGA
jgi:hypothetical protein